MIPIKTEKELEYMREAARIVAELLVKLGQMIRPGVNTLELDQFAEDLIRSYSATPSFKGYTVPGLPPFSGSICASVNDCIVHGVPQKSTVLAEGDIVGIDVGACYHGYHGDGARTYAVGAISPEATRLMDVTREALRLGVAQAVAGNRVGDIAGTIGAYVQQNGYFVADDLTGHGVGKHLHEEPTVPNQGIIGKGPRLYPGMTIAIEPMVNIGTNRIRDLGWPVHVADGTLSAHFEHTVLITRDEPEILTKI